ncbi:MAG: pantoate--beta-alanine ligase [Planctomycetales bacterium]|nr:pantoate--beta-alanine ligase [Planctomycetales bacterium]
MTESLRLVQSREDLNTNWSELRARGAIGLVPTMGALHEGHLQLVDASRRACETTVVTIFVNPTQFGPGEDLQRYPRDLDGDLAKLRARGVDMVFAPSLVDVYRPGHETFVEVGPVAAPMEGACRPGHFRGVATIVLKLFQLAPADKAFFGRKDYQQTLVIKQMVHDFDLRIGIEVCPIVREDDGLAMSSRNAYLDRDERQRALSLWRGLQLAEQMCAAGHRDAAELKAAVRRELEESGRAEVEYVEIVRDGTVSPVTLVDEPAVVCIAVRIGATRLIDNHKIGS